MSHVEQQVNKQLRRLDAEHRSGRLALDDYRRQRRQHLATLLDGVEITARHTLRRPTPGEVEARGRQSEVLAGGFPQDSQARSVAASRARGQWLLLLAMAGLCGWLFYRLWIG